MVIDINEYDFGIVGLLFYFDYVLYLVVEGIIRGVGIVVIKVLVIYLKVKGRCLLILDVISELLVIVKNKVGFKFVEEF